MTHSLLLSALLAAPAGEPGTWPAFLGQGAGPADPASIPVEWSPEKNIAWAADLPGFGQSSPVVWKDKVFVTAVEGPNKETNQVVALSLADGKELWRSSTPTAFKAENNLYVSRAAPTPCADAQHVYCYFESGDVFALTHVGKEVWRRNLTAEFGPPKNKFGLGASPCQTDEAIFVLVDDEGPSYLIALAKADGKTLWKADRTPRTSWSSPAVVPVGGKPQVVVSSAGSVDGYDPTTGKLLWSMTEGIGGNTVATPVPFADGKFLVAASPGQSGERTEEAKTTNFAVEIEAADGGRFEPKILWRTDKAFPSFGSPVVYAGHAYWVNRQGVVYCFDAATGEQAYADERTGQSVWATPLGLGDRVYLFGKDGLTTVLAAGPDFKVLAENRLWNPDAAKPDATPAGGSEQQRRAAGMFSGPTQYASAAVDGSLLVRTGTTLYCVRKK